MSASPPFRRLSETSSSSKESLINAYEAEEERIINILSRKLEKVSMGSSYSLGTTANLTVVMLFAAQGGEDRARECP